jgi:IS30 family transposase
MSCCYSHLSLEDRVVVQTQFQLGLTPAAIAAGHNRARSTITREMARNRGRPASLATRTAAAGETACTSPASPNAANAPQTATSEPSSTP